MQIIVSFKFDRESTPTAVTGVEGAVTDILLPVVGDVVRHRDAAGNPFEGKITDRIFEYQLGDGVAVEGGIAVTLCLDRMIVH